MGGSFQDIVDVDMARRRLLGIDDPPPTQEEIDLVADLELVYGDDPAPQKIHEFRGIVPDPPEAAESSKIAQLYGLGDAVFFKTTHAGVWVRDPETGRHRPQPGMLVAFPFSPLGGVVDLKRWKAEHFIRYPYYLIWSVQKLQIKRGVVIPPELLYAPTYGRR